MPAYDAEQFDPPAPLAMVTLRNPENGAIQSDVPMLLDSGADVTLVPEAVLDLLGTAAVPDRQYELTGFDGSMSLASVVRLELGFCDRTFRGQFLLIDHAWGVMGRNVLNALRILFDGPNLVWNEHRPS